MEPSAHPPAPVAAAPRLALVFPGQGSQRPGMGAPWVDHPAFALVRRAGAEAERLLLEADADELRRPLAAQVSTFLTSLVVLEAARAAGLDEPVAVAGHSLGEYTALVAAGVLSTEDGLHLVGERGAAMQAAADAAPGTMAAVLGAEAADVTAACEGVEAWPANDNAPGHVVISGTAEGVAAAGEAAKERGARRVMPIPVGGAYHTPLMEPARERLAAAIDAARFADARVPVVANVDAAAHPAGADWPVLLRAQLTAPVLWRTSVATLTGLGATAVVELGPGGVLAGLVKRCAPGVPVHSVATPDELTAALAALAELR